jgi:hypothetical protein
MFEYSVFPFIAGKVSFVNQYSDPHFQIDLTTSESIVFFESSFYPCYMVHNSVKEKLIESGLKGFRFPDAKFTVDFSLKNQEVFDGEQNVPNWSWIVFEEIRDEDVGKYSVGLDAYVNETGEIICNEAFLNILKSRRLKRAKVVDLKSKIINEKISNQKENDIFKKEKSFSIPVFSLIFFTALIVAIIIFV